MISRCVSPSATQSVSVQSLPHSRAATHSVSHIKLSVCHSWRRRPRSFPFESSQRRHVTSVLLLLLLLLLLRRFSTTARFASQQVHFPRSPIPTESPLSPSLSLPLFLSPPSRSLSSSQRRRLCGSQVSRLTVAASRALSRRRPRRQPAFSATHCKCGGITFQYSVGFTFIDCRWMMVLLSVSRAHCFNNDN